MARIPLTISGRRLDTGPMVDYSGIARSPVGQALEGAGQTVQAIGARYQAMQEQRDAFAAEQERMRLNEQFEQQLPDFLSKVPEDGSGLHDGGLKLFDEQTKKTIASVPLSQRPKFAELMKTERERQSTRLAQVEQGQRQTWFRGGVNRSAEQVEIDVFNDPSRAAEKQAELIRSIDATGLDEVEKAELRRKAGDVVSIAAIQAGIASDPAYVAGNLGIATMQADTSSLSGSLVRSQISVESGGNPNAISPKGAAGLMQVMPGTGKEIAGELGDANFPASGSVAEQQAYLQREDVSLRYGTHYMNKMLTRYGGDVEAALVAYNGGPARADAWLKANRDDSVIPKESADYYKKVLAGAGMAIQIGSPALQSHIEVAKAFIGAQEGRDAVPIAAFIKKATGVNLDPRQTAWCAAWLNAVFESQGVQGTGKLNAQSFLDFGAEVQNPSIGDVVVLSRGGPGSGQGHVGLFAGFDSNGNPRVLGGNQSKQVSVATFNKDEVLGYRRPPSVKTTADANERLARLPGGGPTGGMVVTNLDPRYANLSLSQRLQFQDEASRALSQRQATFTAQQNATEAAYKDALELKALRGEVSEEQVFADPYLSDGSRATLIRTVRAQRRERTENETAIDRFIAGDLDGANPRDDSDVSSVDRAYRTMMERLADAPSEDRVAFTRETVRRTGIIPKGVQAEIARGVLDTNSPQAYVQAMETASSIQTDAPVAFGLMPSEIRKEHDEYLMLTRERGMPSAEAARKLLERRQTGYAEKEKAYGQAADKWAGDQNVSDVSSQLSGWIPWNGTSLPDTPAENSRLMVEYRAALREGYIEANGDEASAKRRALSTIQDTWGISTIGGNQQVAKYPPEKFYPMVNGSHDYMREDLMTSAKGVWGEQVSNVAVIADRQTADEINRQVPPSYLALIETQVDGESVWQIAPSRWAISADVLRRHQSKERGDRAIEFLSRDDEINLERDIYQSGNDAAASTYQSTEGPAAVQSMSADFARQNAIMSRIPDLDRDDARRRVEQRRRELFQRNDERREGINVNPMGDAF